MNVLKVNRIHNLVDHAWLLDRSARWSTCGAVGDAPPQSWLPSRRWSDRGPFGRTRGSALLRHRQPGTVFEV